MSGFGRIAGLAPALAAVISLGHSADAQESARPLNCAIKPLKVIEVAAPIPGVLADVLVRPGQQVASGDVIARLDVDLETAELEAARVRADAEGAEKIAAARRSAAAPPRSIPLAELKKTLKNSPAPRRAAVRWAPR